MAGKNVLIPLSLLNSLIEFLNELDLSEYHELSWEYGQLLWALEMKKQKLNLRDSYAKIISADNEDDRHDARMEYLSKRNQLDALNF